MVTCTAKYPLPCPLTETMLCLVVAGCNRTTQPKTPALGTRRRRLNSRSARLSPRNHCSAASRPNISSRCLGAAPPLSATSTPADFRPLPPLPPRLLRRWRKQSAARRARDARCAPCTRQPLPLRRRRLHLCGRRPRACAPLRWVRERWRRAASDASSVMACTVACRDMLTVRCATPSWSPASCRDG
jgi:hypothetical protein